MTTSFSGGRSRSTRREPPTMGKQLISFITCGCESSVLFCNLQSREQAHGVLVIGLYELLDNPTTQLIETPEHLLIKWYTLYLKWCRKTRVLHNKLSYMWRLALYPHVEITYMTIISLNGEVWGTSIYIEVSVTSQNSKLNEYVC
jgi:hypothetical protein